MRLQAFSKGTGEPVNVGDTVLDFRGTEWKLSALDRANGPGNDGKITVSEPETDAKRYFYAGVCNLEIRWMSEAS